MIGNVILSTGEVISGNSYLNRIRKSLNTVTDKNSEWYKARNTIWHTNKKILSRGIDLKSYNVMERGFEEIKRKFLSNELDPFVRSMYVFFAGMGAMANNNITILQKFGLLNNSNDVAVTDDLKSLEEKGFLEIINNKEVGEVKVEDFRKIDQKLDLIITDPPYGGDVNYSELSEFFLAWDKTLFKKVFPNWPTWTNRQADATNNFDEIMRQGFENLKKCLSSGGQMILFFASNKKKVWEDLFQALKGLFKMTSCVPILTEPVSALRKGNRYNVSMMLTFRHIEEVEYTNITYENVLENLKKCDDDDITEQLSEADRLNIRWACELSNEK